MCICARALGARRVPLSVVATVLVGTGFPLQRSRLRRRSTQFGSAAEFSATLCMLLKTTSGFPFLLPVQYPTLEMQCAIMPFLCSVYP